MSAIAVQELSKSYRVAVKQPGLRGARRHLVRREEREIHAVRDVSFEVEPGEIVQLSWQATARPAGGRVPATR